ncbi:MAG: helix-turn-helix domain-containing protein [Firmicutes bacterium]|jgi:Mn-dependent DtxR family transcriptional regulator|nr:helix-turn-helix domain-containing protein [Bacillota bacterium]
MKKKKKRDFYTVRGYELKDQEEKTLTPAMEDYLEMIYRGILERDHVRINALAERLNVKPSSASRMVQKLADMGFLKYEKYGIIFLTEQGSRIGEFLLQRHRIIEEFMAVLSDEDSLLKETEMIEHHVSPATLQNMHMLNLFLRMNPDVIRRFNSFKQSHELAWKKNE